MILAAYEQWGEAMFSRLIGDFALVIWDPAQRRLLAARDPFGVRPLYYYHSPDGEFIACASEIRQLLAHPAIPRKLDMEIVENFLAFRGRIDMRRTFYQGIRRAPPAHALVFDAAGLRLRRYWSLEEAPPVRYRAEADYVDHFRELLREAVRCRLRSDRPVGLMLSGGMDSTAIASLSGPNTLEAFSLVYDELHESDERDNIMAVRERYSLPGQYIIADELWPLADFPNGLAGADEPQRATQYNLHFATYERARHAGRRVLLTGWLGDEVCIEPAIAYFNLLRKFRLGRFVTEARQWSKWRGGLPTLHLRSGLLDTLPPNLRKRLLATSTYATTPWLTPEFRQRLQRQGRKATGMDLPATSLARVAGVAGINGDRRQGWSELFEQGMSAHGLEGRHPFSDKRLLEFAFGAPLALFFRPDIGSKPLLKQAMRDLLPEQILRPRPRVLQDPVVKRGLRTRGQPVIAALMADSMLARLGLIDVTAFRRYYNAYQGGESDDSWLIWNTITLEAWLRDFRD